MSGVGESDPIIRRATELAQARVGDVCAQFAGQIGAALPGADIHVEGEQIILSGRGIAGRWARLGPELMLGSAIL